MRRKYRAMGALVGLMTVLALTACSHAQQPTPFTPTPFSPSSSAGSPSMSATTTPSPSPSTATTPTVAKPTLAPMPASAKVYSAAGLQSFVTWWIKAMDYAQATGNTTAMFSSCTKDPAELCTALVKDWSAVYRAGGHYVSAPTRIKKWNISRVPGDHLGYVEALIQIQPDARVAKAGAKPLHQKGGDGILVVDGRFASGRWIITHISLQKVSL